MPFDALALAAVGDEVRVAVERGRIQKITQPGETSVALEVYSQGIRSTVLLAAEVEAPRVQLTGRRPVSAFEAPPPFTMLLRKYLEGARIEHVEVVRTERILILHCKGAEDLRLMTEVMGKHSNIVLVNAADEILGAVKIVPPRLSRVRPILPGRAYRLPPAQPRDFALYGPGPRLDPGRDPAAIRRLLAAAPPETDLRVALLGLLAGASPFLAEQIVRRSGFPLQAQLEDVDPEAVAAAAQGLYSLYDNHEWTPCTFATTRSRRDFAPYLPLGVEDVQVVESLSAAIDLAQADRTERDPLAVGRKQLIGDIERRRRSVRHRTLSLQQGLSASEGAEEVMQQGRLLLAFQHDVAAGQEQLDLPELGVSIPLDPRLSAVDNAERLFRRYRKLRDARRRIPPLLAEAQAEDQRLEDLAAFAALAGTPAELRELRRELERSREEAPRGRDRRRSGPLEMTLDGHSVLLGRNARQNEEVTFRLARRGDLWLHARNRTGAHVVLRREAGEPPDEIVEAAARLAAQFSEGRTDSRVDVDVTEVRNVRKIPGGPPGRVTYRNFRTLRVEPGAGGWQPARVNASR